MSESPLEVANRVLAQLKEAAERRMCDPELIGCMEVHDAVILARAYLYLRDRYAESQTARYENLHSAQTTSDTLATMIVRLQLYKDIVDTVLEWREITYYRLRNDVEVKLLRLANQERLRREEEH